MSFGGKCDDNDDDDNHHDIASSQIRRNLLAII